MLEKTKNLCAAIAVTVITSTFASANAAPETNTALTDANATISGEPLSFGTQSSAVSSFIRGPDWMLVALTFANDSHGADVIGGIGVSEGILRRNSFTGGQLEFGWSIAGLGSAASSAAASSLFGGITPYFVLGAIAQTNDVNYLTRAPNLFFPTGNAKTKFYGVYTGFNLLLLGDPLEAASSSAASSSFGGFSWMVFGNAGYGEASVDVPNFNFYRSSEGLFYQVGTRVLFDLGAINVGPGVSYLYFDNGPITIDEVLYSLDFMVPF